MADAPEALADVLEALNRAFISNKASGDDPSVQCACSSSSVLAVAANISCLAAALRCSVARSSSGAVT
jgi:hypothetical protein